MSRSLKFTAVLRRLLAITLTVVLLAPWIAALSSAAVLIVPCPMHRSGGVTSPDRANAVAGAHHESAEHQTGSHHGTSARGCNCAGECGRSGSAFSLPARTFVGLRSSGLAEPTIAGGRFDFSLATGLLPPATGPPQRLRI